MTADTLFRPRPALPRISPAAARAGRLLSVRRPLAVAGAVALAIGPPPAAVAEGEPIWFGTGDEIGRALVPRPLLADILRSLDPAAPDAPPPWRALLLEVALADVLARLHAACPALAPAMEPEPPAALPPGMVAFGLRVGEHDVRVEVGARTLAAVLDAIAALPPSRAARPDIPVPLSVRWGTAALPLAALRSLQAGDVVIAETPGDGGVLLLAADHLAWRAGWSAGRVTVTGPRMAAGGWEGRTMGDETALAGPEGLPDAALDALPVRLGFELGRLELTLAELQAVGPGYVFELARAESEAVDIVANGRRIGRGRIVEVGGALGVQVVRLGV